ncbi:hypothetical protein LCGC14_2129140 [marine sediment metagenome]|uniref:Uncharacterized protein n=1 Tax=marine sediment metagenome TaxID=412755 RepID=A0A0F9E203_9ZZZZ
MDIIAAEKQRKRRAKLIAEGKCTVCKNLSDNLPKLRCVSCTTGRVKSDNQKRREKRYARGLCTNCGKNPHKPDKRRCQECCDKNQQWYHESSYKVKNRILDKQRRKDRRQRIIDHYGGKCVCCGESEPVFLSIDHINNDGADHRANITKKKGRGKQAGSTTMYKWIERNNYPTDLQLLCHNCNMGRYRNGGICPHKEMANE